MGNTFYPGNTPEADTYANKDKPGTDDIALFIFPGVKTDVTAAALPDAVPDDSKQHIDMLNQNTDKLTFLGFGSYFFDDKAESARDAYIDAMHEILGYGKNDIGKMNEAQKSKAENELSAMRQKEKASKIKVWEDFKIPLNNVLRARGVDTNGVSHADGPKDVKNTFKVMLDGESHQGDSGGGLVKEVDGKFVVIGINAQAENYKVWETDVAKYRDWIDTTINAKGGVGARLQYYDLWTKTRDWSRVRRRKRHFS